jgi:hypothetical protein
MNPGWREIKSKIKQYSEQELLDLIEIEKKHNRRLTVAVRMHQRYCMLRMIRERAAIERAIDDDRSNLEGARQNADVHPRPPVYVQRVARQTTHR